MSMGIASEFQNIERYSSQSGIPIRRKLYAGLSDPEKRFGSLYAPFLDCALGELYKHKVECVLRNKEGITSKLAGDPINFFGALSEICVAGVFAPFIQEHSSPDLILAVGRKSISVEIRNRLSRRGKIKSNEWGKEHRAMVEGTRKKKRRNPNFIFVAVLERASEPAPSWLRTNIPKEWVSGVVLTPREELKKLLSAVLNGIFCYDIVPIHINSWESVIANTDLALRFVDIFRNRLVELFPPRDLGSTIYVLGKIRKEAVSLTK